jgi:uncharacterized protein
MKLEQSFEVAAPLELVWEALVDVDQVAPCLPGAAVTGRNDDGSYSGTFSVKIGPTSASYTGKLEMENIDETAHTATMQAQGTDKRGQGGATATIVSTLSPGESERTRVEVITDYHITGRLARFGRGGMIEDISERLLRQFADCLQRSLAGEPSSAASGAGGDAPGAGEGASGGDGEALGAKAGEPTGATSAPQPAPGVEPPPPGEQIDAFSLTASVLWGRVRRNPAPVIALILGFLLAAAARRRTRS